MATLQQSLETLRGHVWGAGQAERQGTAARRHLDSNGEALGISQG